MNYYPELRLIIKIEHHKTPLKASLSNTSPPPPTFQGKKVDKPLSLLTPPPLPLIIEH